ncbi:hypothetical protein D8Y22_17155 [Salinadaptatus halalkaliphilus]|uniref:Uncharacterized protein n=1 Tax=Salinadaptatus halalkaliphilus TaxID=2419781 RepID=A0A4S3THY6_9EURY|nr:hypothetical protein [Salinadaptatus halalkaliphilus]THE63551.1 hypothetical protein D8Y22_17155 [Salinadaptatus halalkaliphilus]
MSDFQQRRRVLQLAGTGVAASIAGCSDLSVSDDPDGDESTGTELTAVAEPSSEDLQELEQAVQAGELSQEEAYQRQMELFEGAIEQFEDRAAAEADDDLRIEESEGEMGIYLIDGSADVIIDALRTGDISVLGDTDLYEQLLQQQQPPQGDGQEIDEDELEEQLQEQVEEQETADGDEDAADGE